MIRNTRQEYEKENEKTDCMKINSEQDEQKVDKILSQLQWTRPLGLKKWADMFEVHPNTMRIWFKKQYISNKQISPRMWRVAFEELPAEYVAKILLNFG